MRRWSRALYHLTSIPVLLAGFREWGAMARALLRPSGGRPFTVTLRRSGLRFRVRSAMDVWVLRETCLGREYEQFGTELRDGWTYLDVGAAFGDFAVWVAHRFPRSTVYACEPFPQSFDLLQHNLALNRIGNVKPLPYALGARSGPMRLYPSSAQAVEFSTVRAAPHAEGHEVQGISLDDLFRTLSLERCDFLKMDCEGAEFEILFAANPRTLGRIQHLCLEYHDGVTKHSHEDLAQYLTQHGFAVRHKANRAWRGLGLLSAEREELVPPLSPA